MTKRSSPLRRWRELKKRATRLEVGSVVETNTVVTYCKSCGIRGIRSPGDTLHATCSRCESTDVRGWQLPTRSEAQDMVGLWSTVVYPRHRERGL